MPFLIRWSVYVAACLSVTVARAQPNPVDGRPTIPINWPYLDPITDSIAGISLNRAYDLLQGRPSVPVVVGVLDSGVDIEHRDLRDVIWTNPAETPGNGLDDDRNGYVDDQNGWNFMAAKDGKTYERDYGEVLQIYFMWKNRFEGIDSTKRTSPVEKRQYATYQLAKKQYEQRFRTYTYDSTRDQRRITIGDNPTDLTERYYGSGRMRLDSSEQLAVHGTHVAGIIAARRGNGIGIDGVADNVRIMPVSVVPAGGDERDKDVANGIRYAVENGAKVINMSFGKRFSPFKEEVDAAIRFAEERDVLLVHAAGNNGEDYDSLPAYPSARYENGQTAGNVIVVGNNTHRLDEGLPAPSSNYGYQTVDLFAPGSRIASTVPRNQYALFSGTSMAAPHVAGVAALLRSYFPTLTAVQVKKILLDGSYKPGLMQMVRRPGRLGRLVPFGTLSQSGGLLNAYEAVKMAIGLTEK